MHVKHWWICACMMNWLVAASLWILCVWGAITALSLACDTIWICWCVVYRQRRRIDGQKCITFTVLISKLQLMLNWSVIFFFFLFSHIWMHSAECASIDRLVNSIRRHSIIIIIMLMVVGGRPVGRSGKLSTCTISILHVMGRSTQFRNFRRVAHEWWWW